MKAAHARARAFAPASRERSPLNRRPAFAPEPPAEVPDLETQMDRAARFGHRLETALGGGEVIQRQDSDDEEDSSSDGEGYEAGEETSDDEEEAEDDSDEDFFMPEPRKGSKKQDPSSAMKAKTYKTTGNSFQYETEGGSKHTESFDPKKLSRTTKTTGLKLTGPQHRNNAMRSGVGLQVFNPYKLSKGQSTLNQAVVSHNSPSWLGMRAGGNYGNSSETSGFFNSQVEKKEKPWRDEIGNTSEPFEYETQTQYEKLRDNLRHKEIAKLMTNKKWQDPERVKTRLERIAKKNPNAMRVLSEKRTLTGKISGQKRSRNTSLGTDYYYGIPRRAYDKKAHKKYIDARGQDSEGSDYELESSKPPKKKIKTK